MRTLKFPKPPKRGKKKPKRIKRRRPVPRGTLPIPKARAGSRAGDYKARAKYAGDLWRELIRLKEPSGICPRCRQRKWYDTCHGIPRGRRPALRFEVTNGIPLCRVCHRIVDADAVEKVHLWTWYEGEQAWRDLEFRALTKQGKLDLGLTILFLEGELERAKAAGVYRTRDREKVVRDRPPDVPDAS